MRSRRYFYRTHAECPWVVSRQTRVRGTRYLPWRVRICDLTTRFTNGESDTESAGRSSCWQAHDVALGIGDYKSSLTPPSARFYRRARTASDRGRPSATPGARPGGLPSDTAKLSVATSLRKAVHGSISAAGRVRASGSWPAALIESGDDLTPTYFLNSYAGLSRLNAC
jgi:hypothetical protein